MTAHSLDLLDATQHAVEDPDPDCVIEFAHLPSWNDINAVSANIHAKASLTRKWRHAGEKKVCDWAKRRKLKTEVYVETFGKHNEQSRLRERLITPFFTRAIAIDCRVWRPDSRPYDVHNVCLKAVLDGFRDARLMINDDTRYVTEVSFVFEGVDTSLALTSAEREERRLIQQARKLNGKSPKRMPARARYRIEFFRLA